MARLSEEAISEIGTLYGVNVNRWYALEGVREIGVTITPTRNNPDSVPPEKQSIITT